jgi:hypothetical protein
MLAFVLYELVFPTPWFPMQAISVAGQKPFNGYVLSQADGKTFILTSWPVGVINLPSRTILATAQCTPSDYVEQQATIVEVFDRAVKHILINYPSCPSTRYGQSDQVRSTPSPSPSPSPSLAPSSSLAPSPLPSGRA